jgi:hypothetical protein
LSPYAKSVRKKQRTINASNCLKAIGDRKVLCIRGDGVEWNVVFV